MTKLVQYKGHCVGSWICPLYSEWVGRYTNIANLDIEKIRKQMLVAYDGTRIRTIAQIMWTEIACQD